MFKRKTIEPTERLDTKNPRCTKCGESNTRVAFIDLNAQSARVTCRDCDNSFKVGIVDSRPQEQADFGVQRIHSN